VVADLIDTETWTILGADVKGDAYEGLLERNAQDTKSGAGQYFTLLRLPTGLFYAQGVKANVLFFEKKPASESPWTKKLWIYDLRTNKHFTLKTNPLRREDLAEFVGLYKAANRHQREATWSAEQPEGRWRAYSHEDIVARDKASLDILWLKDDSLADSDNLPPPEVIAQEIVEDLQAALEQFKLIAGDLGAEVTEPA
jgi:type I restriction enzyme M protein